MMTKEELQRQIETKYVISLDKRWIGNTLFAKVRTWLYPNDVFAIVKFGELGLGKPEEMRKARFFFVQEAQEQVFAEIMADEYHPFRCDDLELTECGWDYEPFVNQYMKLMEEENARLQRRAGKAQSRRNPATR